MTQGPIDEALAYRDRVGNKMTWYSTADSPFGADMGAPTGGGFQVNVFLRVGDTVYRTYNTQGRGTEQLSDTFPLIDLLPYGRQEEWQDSPDGWPQSPTYSRWADSEAFAQYADARLTTRTHHNPSASGFPPALEVWIETLTRSLPADSIIGRLGGAEFGVAIPKATAENALILLEEVRATWQNTRWTGGRSTPRSASRRGRPTPPRRPNSSAGECCARPGQARGRWSSRHLRRGEDGAQEQLLHPARS